MNAQLRFRPSILHSPQHGFFGKNGLRRCAHSNKKRIPSEAGLGGASADAAAVLHGMQQLFGSISRDELYDIAKRVGADVPFCLHGGCALCEGIGEKLTPAPSAALPLLLVRGNRGISTGALFRSLDLGKSPHAHAIRVPPC